MTAFLHLLLHQDPLPFSLEQQRSGLQGCTGSSVCMCVCVLSCAVKFLCQRKSSLTRLQQTRYDSVQGRPNRAPIQLPATGSLLLRQSPLTARPLRARKEGSSPPWKSTSHVPVWGTSDVSFCYHEFLVNRQAGQCPHGLRRRAEEDLQSAV